VSVPRGMTKSIEIAELEWKAGLIPIDVKEQKREEKKEN
jgi:DNA-directed RNA polymerase subunit K/omega